MEEWRDLPKYEGSYQVSSEGRVRSLKFNKIRLLNPTLGSDGYLILSLSLKGNIKVHYVHILVAICFHEHEPDGMNVIVDHKDDNKQNNYKDNLQVTSQRVNTSKRMRGSSKYTGVCWHKIHKKWIASISKKGKQKYIGYFDNEKQASDAYNRNLKNN